MLSPRIASCAVAATALALVAVVQMRPVAAQPTEPVDFVRDVQPILRQRCVGCHGPSQQMVGLRLDRRRDAMRGSTFGTVIGPGNVEASRLLLRVAGLTAGPQMPPTGALPPAEIDILRRWIAGGAVWPDVASGDAPEVPPDPGAVRVMSLLRTGDDRGARRALAQAPSSAVRTGRDGVTPLMYAALYGTVSSMRALLDGGADPNARNDAGATALMWAVDDEAKTALLLSRGADANARSLDGRAPPDDRGLSGPVQRHSQPAPRQGHRPQRRI